MLDCEKGFSSYFDINGNIWNPFRAAQNKRRNAIKVICDPEAPFGYLLSERISAKSILLGATMIAKFDTLPNCHPGDFPNFKNQVTLLVFEVLKETYHRLAPL